MYIIFTVIALQGIISRRIKRNPVLAVKDSAVYVKT